MHTIHTKTHPVSTEHSSSCEFRAAASTHGAKMAASAKRLAAAGAGGSVSQDTSMPLAAAASSNSPDAGKSPRPCTCEAQGRAAGLVRPGV